jgi:hypothetical protein
MLRHGLSIVEIWEAMYGERGKAYTEFNIVQ